MYIYLKDTLGDTFLGAPEADKTLYKLIMNGLVTGRLDTGLDGYGLGVTSGNKLSAGLRSCVTVQRCTKPTIAHGCPKYLRYSLLFATGHEVAWQ